MVVTVVLLGIPQNVYLADLANMLQQEILKRDEIGTFLTRRLPYYRGRKRVALDFLSAYDAMVAESLLNGYDYQLEDGTEYTLRARVTHDPDLRLNPEDIYVAEQSNDLTVATKRRINWSSDDDDELKLEACLQSLKKKLKIVKKKKELIKASKKLKEYEQKHSEETNPNSEFESPEQKKQSQSPPRRQRYKSNRRRSGSSTKHISPSRERGPHLYKSKKRSQSPRSSGALVPYRSAHSGFSPRVSPRKHQRSKESSRDRVGSPVRRRWDYFSRKSPYCRASHRSRSPSTPNAIVSHPRNRASPEIRRRRSRRDDFSSTRWDCPEESSATKHSPRKSYRAEGSTLKRSQLNSRRANSSETHRNEMIYVDMSQAKNTSDDLASANVSPVKNHKKTAKAELYHSSPVSAEGDQFWGAVDEILQDESDRPNIKDDKTDQSDSSPEINRINLTIIIQKSKNSSETVVTTKRNGNDELLKPDNVIPNVNNITNDSLEKTVDSNSIQCTIVKAENILQGNIDSNINQCNKVTSEKIPEETIDGITIQCNKPEKISQTPIDSNTSRCTNAKAEKMFPENIDTNNKATPEVIPLKHTETNYSNKIQRVEVASETKTKKHIESKTLQKGNKVIPEIKNLKTIIDINKIQCTKGLPEKMTQKTSDNNKIQCNKVIFEKNTQEISVCNKVAIKPNAQLANGYIKTMNDGVLPQNFNSNPQFWIPVKQILKKMHKYTLGVNGDLVVKYRAVATVIIKWRIRVLLKLNCETRRNNWNYIIELYEENFPEDEDKDFVQSIIQDVKDDVYGDISALCLPNKKKNKNGLLPLPTPPKVYSSGIAEVILRLSHSIIKPAEKNIVSSTNDNDVVVIERDIPTITISDSDGE